MKNQKGFAPILIILIVVIAVGVIFVLGEGKLNSIVTIGTPVASATSDPTANWKTYTDQAYSYSVKYPGNWYFRPSINLQPLQQPEPVFIASFDINNTTLPTDPKELANQLQISISIITKQPNLTLSEQISQNSSVITQKNIQINGTSGIQTEEKAPAFYGSSGFTIIKVYLPNPNSKIYTVITATPSNSKFIDIFSQILSTFKFTN